MTDTLRKILGFMDPGEHRRLAAIVGAMIVTGLLQTIGIASIMPFLAVVSNPALIQEDPNLAAAYQLIGSPSTESFVFALGVFFMVAMVASNALSTFTGWVIVKFQWRTHDRLSNRLLARYLGAPYAYHLDHNSARLGSSLLGQVAKVTGGLFLPCAQILSRGISSLFIVALLVLVDPVLALLVSASIGGFYGVVYTFVRQRQSRLGEAVVAAKTERHLVSNEAFGGIKEVKVLGREGHFLERFRVPSRKYSKAQAANTLVGLIPRFSLETVAYGGIVAVTLYLLRSGDTLDEVFPLLAVYAFGANRLIPGVQEIFSALTKIRFQAPAVDELYQDLHGAPAGPRAPRDPSPGVPAVLSEPVTLRSGITVENMTFQYSNSVTPALRGVTLDIPVNRTVALVGSTGSGKTTLVDLLLGLFDPTEGRILVDGKVLDERILAAWRQKVGYVPQTIFLCDASIAENIAFGLPKGAIDREAVREAARAAHLEPFVASLPSGYDTVVGERGIRLSGGQRQRIGIARALYHRPEFLVMDEATSALDNVTEDVVMNAIQELGGRRTILLIAHRLTTVKESDIIYLMEEGRVVGRGSYDELVASSPTFRAMTRV